MVTYVDSSNSKVFVEYIKIGVFFLIPQEAMYLSWSKKLRRWIPFWWTPEIMAKFFKVSEFHKWRLGFSPNSPVAINEEFFAFAMLITSFYIEFWVCILF